MIGCSPLFRLRGSLALLALFFLLGALPGQAQEDWLTSVDTAKNRAQSEKKRILLFFTADWCKYCIKMRREVLENEVCKTYIEQNLVPVMIDADKERALVDSFKVTAFPTFLILDCWGGVIETLQGDMPLETFLKGLQKAAKLPDKLRPPEADEGKGEK